MAKNKIVYASYIFSDDDETLRSGNEYQITSLIADELQADTIELEVKCSDKNIVVFTENAPLQYYRENLLRSTYYVQSIKRIGGDKYTISADSAMGLLMKRLHVGGIYTGQTVKEVVNEICGNIPILVKTVFADTKLYGWLPYCKPPESSARNNLAQVLYAIGAALTTDNNGVLRVEPLWDGVSSSIGETRMYFDGSVETEKPISAVTVTEHQYIAGTDEKELFSGTSQQGDIITFSEPMHSLTATGFTVLESGANYAKISSGSGSLKGKTYIHNTRLVTQTVTENAAENVKSVTDATLVSLVNSSAVAKRLADYYKCRETITNGIVSGQEKPGHVVSVYHPYDKKMVSACIVSLDTTMSGTLKSEMAALVGFLPPQPETTEYYDERAVLTGSGSWPVPEGARGLKAILVQAGGGGYSGENGDDAATPEHTANYGAYKNGGQANGGAGGLPGVCGKILQIDVNIQGQSLIPYSCGAGGTGGSAVRGEASQAGADGGHTTFGDYSSKDGDISNAGYVDPITGEVYAAPVATQGIHGGISSGATGTYMDNFVQGNPVVDEDGNTWTAGVPGNQLPRNEVYLGSSSLYIYSNAGSGGGAAVGANGGTGYAGAVTKDTAETGTGGDGANAIANTKIPNCYGSGGYGGHGGGGGGGSGMCSAQLDPWDKTFTVGPLARGGLGGKGGSGAPGCIILYYRRPKLVQSGPLVTSNNYGLLDSLGRRMIV